MDSTPSSYFSKEFEITARVIYSGLHDIKGL